VKMFCMNTKTKSCLQCDKPVNGKGNRGLCSRCYYRYQNAIRRLDKTKRKPFEQALIAAEKILPPSKRKPSSHDPYGELADQLQHAEPSEVDKIIENFRIENEKSQNLSVQAEADIVVENVKQAARRKGITPKDTSE